MRCELCPIATEDDVCGAATERSDGSWGCRIPANKIRKMEADHDRYYEIMGIDMSVDFVLENKGLPVEKVLKICKHMVGLDYSKPYTRHGKKFYKPYRNYFDAPSQGEAYLDVLPSFIINRTQESPEEDVWYTLTRLGLDWLGRQIRVKIYYEEK